MDDLLNKQEDENGNKKVVGLTDEGKETLKAAKAKKKGGIGKDETIHVQLEDGYLFSRKHDGIVRFRSDEQHAEILEGNQFQEPAPRKQHPSSAGAMH